MVNFLLAIWRYLRRSCIKLGSHGRIQTPASGGAADLAHDLLHFETTLEVPDDLSRHVVSSKKAQANWYDKLSEEWQTAKRPPETEEEAAAIVIQAMKGHKKADVEGFLAFYGLPKTPTPQGSGARPPPKPQGVKYELKSLPVDLKSIPDGDTITVYVDAADVRESGAVPKQVLKAAKAKARAKGANDFKGEKAHHRIITDAGYRVVSGQNGEETLAKKYRIRLRGIDAPESAMPYGKEAKEEMVQMVQGKRVRVLIYGGDRYGRFVGDIYTNGTFVQERMLRKGFAWHYKAYDQRPELEAWEKEAREARLGLWAQANPEKPWDWRRNRRNAA